MIKDLDENETKSKFESKKEMEFKKKFIMYDFKMKKPAKEHTKKNSVLK